MKSLYKYTLIVVLLLVAGALFYKRVYIPKITFSLVSPKVGEIKASVSGIGNVGAQDIYKITAQSGGKIVNIFTNEGKWVKKGDLLVEMDGVDLPDQLQIATATLKKAKFELIASKNELKSQQAQKLLLQKSYERYNKLNKQGFAARVEYDKALANLQGIDATIVASKSHVDSAKAQILLSQKSIDAIKTRIADLKVYAPVDGYVIAKEAEVAQNVLPTNTILKIVDPKTLWVETKIDERISGAIKVGQKAKITLSSQPQKEYLGVVKRVLPVSDPVTLEREVDIGFTALPKPFYINEQAQVAVDTSSYHNVLKVPLKVVVQQNGKVGVWIAKEGRAHFVALKKIAQDEHSIAVSNLDKKSQIIVPDRAKKSLKEGMRIHL